MTALPPYPEATKHSYRPDIDGLRAVAVLAVVAFHFFPEWVRGGFIGVDIFFVISGFLISSIIYRELEHHTFSFIDFYSRRVRRIFPALILVLLSCLVLGWYILLADEYKQLGQHVFAGSGFASNLMLWSESGYFDNASETKPLLHLWSLGIEEQFYLIWPLLLWVLYKKKNNFFLIIILIALASFVANIYLVGKNPVADFYSPVTRFWELMIGSIVAYIFFYKPKYLMRREKWISVDMGLLHEVFSCFGLALLAGALFLLSKESAFPGWWALLPALGAAFILLGGRATWVNSRIFSNPFLVWVGLISFPLYLWHWALLSMARIVEGEVPTVSWRLAIAALSIALAWLTFQLIEKPLRFGGYAKVKTIALIVLMVIIGSLGYYVFARDGVGRRLALPDSTQKLLIRAPEPENDNQRCKNRFPELAKFHYCGITNNSAPTVALIGDSHAYHYYDSFSRVLESNSLIHVKQSSCLPFSSDLQLSQEDCADRVHVVTQFLKENKDIKTIYLSGYWSYLSSSGYGSQGDNWQLPEIATNTDIISFSENGDKFLTNIESENRNIIIMLDTPSLNFNVKSCLNLRPFTLTDRSIKNCLIKKSNYEKQNLIANDALNNLKKHHKNLEIYSPEELFCNDLYCKPFYGDLPLYIDGHHLNKYGSTKVVRDFLLTFPPLKNN